VCGCPQRDVSQPIVLRLTTGQRREPEADAVGRVDDTILEADGLAAMVEVEVVAVQR